MQDRDPTSPAGGEGGSGFVLKVTRGAEKGATYPLNSERTIIGRKAESTIRLADIRVSGEHAAILFEKGRPLLKDLGSANGTFIGDMEVREAPLAAGKHFTVGDTEFQLLEVDSGARNSSGSRSDSPNRVEPSAPKRPASTSASTIHQTESSALQGESSGQGKVSGGQGNASGTTASRSAMSTEESAVGHPVSPDSATSQNDGEEIHVIRDVRPVRKGMGGLVLLLILLVALGGAGYYYFFHLSPTQAVAGTVEPEKGNLIGADWSFEGDSNGEESAWNLKSEDRSFNLTKKDARSGVYAASADLSGGGRAAAEYGRRFPVNGRRRYRASAFVKISGRAMLALKAVFYTRDGEGGEEIPFYVDDFAAGREEGREYGQVEGTVFPPPEADEMAIRFVAAGEGEVTLDDVALFDAPASAPDQIGSSGGMDFFRCGGGFLVRRIGNTLFLGGRVVAVTLDGKGESVSFDSSEEGFHGATEGYLYCGPEVGLVRASRNLKVNAEAIEGDLNVPAVRDDSVTEMRYCFDLLEPMLKGGVGILVGDEYNVFGAAFPAMSADALLLGEGHDRVKVSFEKSIKVLGVPLKSGGLSIQCVFDPSTPVAFRFQLRTDFTDELREAQALVQQAARAEQDKRYGESLALVDQVIRRFAYIESVMDRGQEIRASVLAIKRDWLDGITERLRSAEFLNTPRLFLDLEATCREYLSFFPGDKDLEAAAKEVREKSAVLLDRIREEDAARFYRMARNLRDAGGHDAALKEILDHMQHAFPESEWTAKALNGESDDGGESEEVLDDPEGGLNTGEAESDGNDSDRNEAGATDGESTGGREEKNLEPPARD